MSNLTHYNIATVCHKFTNSRLAFSFFLVYLYSFTSLHSYTSLLKLLRFCVSESNEQYRCQEKQHEVLLDNQSPKEKKLLGPK